MVFANAIATGENTFAGAVGIAADSPNNGIYILNSGLIAPMPSAERRPPASRLAAVFRR
jgi:hypothetical protein